MSYRILKNLKRTFRGPALVRHFLGTGIVVFLSSCVSSYARFDFTEEELKQNQWTCEGRLRDRIIKPGGTGSPFNSSHIEVPGGDENGASWGTHIGAIPIETSDRLFFEPMLRRGMKYHTISGAIDFEVTASLIKPGENGAFWPLDWKFRNKRGADEARIIMNSLVSPDKTVRLSITFATGSKSAMELPDGKFIPKITGLSEKGLKLDPERLYQAAILFEPLDDGFTRMTGILYPTSGKRVYVNRDDVITTSVKFRVHANKIEWSEKLYAGDMRFGIMSPKPAITKSTSLDNLQFFEKAPLRYRRLRPSVP